MHEEGGIIATASALLLWAMILWFIAKPYFKKGRQL
jgi:hypothetical protein